jgi:hypothetical protein
MLTQCSACSHYVVFTRSREVVPSNLHISPSQQAINNSKINTMAALGDVKRQLSNLMVIIKTQGFKLEDAMPEEMQDHFQDMASLVDARAYIKDMEAKESDLQATNARLRAQLEAKQTEIDDHLGEFKALKVDLQQSERRIDYYKVIADHEQSRAGILERRLAETTRLQPGANDDARTIQRLEQALADHEAMAFKLVEENRRLTDQYEAQHEETLKLIAEKEDAVFALRNYANKLEVEKLQVDKDSEHMNDTLNSIIDTLEQQTHSAAEVANSKTVMFYSQRDFNDKLFSTIVSELTPLNRFYDHVTEILAVYQSIIKDLSNPRSGAVHFPQCLDTLLDSAHEQLCAYQQISANLRSEYDLQQCGLAQEAVVSQVYGIAKGAVRLYANLDACKADMTGFLEQLRNQPNAWGKSNDGLFTPTQSIASSRTSMSSFVSFTKRFL